MAFQYKTTDELVRIVMAGGGLTIDGSYKSTDELVRLALATNAKGTKLTIINLTYKTTDELVRIAMAGQGNVTLDG